MESLIPVLSITFVGGLVAALAAGAVAALVAIYVVLAKKTT